VVDLGTTPLANSYATTAEAATNAPRYPLHARVCDRCLLVQVEDAVPADEIFSEYAYFSSYSETWLEHGRRYADWAVDALQLGPQSLVVEVASNDGYLLRHFRDRGVPVLGVEPAANVAQAAIDCGIETRVCFFGDEVGRELALERRADLVVANNVLAHVPDLNDFVAGLASVLAPSGVLSVEVPHVLRLIQNAQFDTIYHEHFSYFSLLSVDHVFRRHGLELFEVVELPTHGGSLRLLAQHRGAGRPQGTGLPAVRGLEEYAELDDPSTYEGFAIKAVMCRQSLLDFLAQARVEDRRVAAYGAAAKGNTLLNYSGVTAADVPFVVDRSPHKQGLFMPGSAIPIVKPDHLDEVEPDYVLVLPWNILDEIMDQMAHIRSWGGQFVTPVPVVQVIA
jgi:SAM-dependent methyltransferase